MDNQVVKSVLSDYVLLREIENDSSIGTILIADEKQAPIRAEVVGVGEQVQKVSAGDVVLFNRGLTTATTIDGEDYLICRDTDLFCIL